MQATEKQHSKSKVHHISAAILNEDRGNELNQEKISIFQPARDQSYLSPFCKFLFTHLASFNA